MRSFGTATVAVLLWLAAALAIDRWLLAPYCATCANALALELKVRIPAAELTYPPVSVLVLVVLPMLVLALFLVPWRHLGRGSAWQESFVRWSQPWFWLLVALVLTVVGESLYLAAKDSLPKALTAVADKFSVTVTLSVLKDYKPLSLTASLFGFLGLALGTCLFLAKGVKDVLTLPSTEVQKTFDPF
jgi:hypothetical protein